MCCKRDAPIDSTASTEIFKCEFTTARWTTQKKTRVPSKTRFSFWSHNYCILTHWVGHVHLHPALPQCQLLNRSLGAPTLAVLQASLIGSIVTALNWVQEALCTYAFRRTHGCREREPFGETWPQPSTAPVQNEVHFGKCEWYFQVKQHSTRTC